MEGHGSCPLSIGGQLRGWIVQGDKWGFLSFSLSLCVLDRGGCIPAPSFGCYVRCFIAIAIADVSGFGSAAMERCYQNTSESHPDRRTLLFFNGGTKKFTIDRYRHLTRGGSTGYRIKNSRRQEVSSIQKAEITEDEPNTSH